MILKNKDEKKWDDIPEGYEEYTDDDFIDDLFDEQDDDEDIPADQRLTKEEFKEIYNEACKEMDKYFNETFKKASKREPTQFEKLLLSDELSKEEKCKLIAEKYGYM